MGRTVRAARAARLKARAECAALRDSVDHAAPIAVCTPERPGIAARLNRLATVFAVGLEELSELRHELGVAERLEPKRRNSE